jgi:hypothetical protein
MSTIRESLYQMLLLKVSYHEAFEHTRTVLITTATRPSRIRDRPLAQGFVALGISL